MSASLLHYIILNCKVFVAQTTSQHRQLSSQDQDGTQGSQFGDFGYCCMHGRNTVRSLFLCGIPASALIVMRPFSCWPLSAVGGRTSVKDLNLVLPFSKHTLIIAQLPLVLPTDFVWGVAVYPPFSPKQTAIPCCLSTSVAIKRSSRIFLVAFRKLAKWELRERGKRALCFPGPYLCWRVGLFYVLNNLATAVKLVIEMLIKATWKCLQFV